MTKTNSQVSADAEAMAKAEAEAAHDAEVLARQAEDEARLRAEAEALAASDAAAAAIEVAPLSFDLTETGAAKGALAAWARAPGSPPMYLIFGGGGTSVPGVAPIMVQAGDFSAEGSTITFAGKTGLIGDVAIGGGVRIDSVALCDSPDGPVRALCEIAGGVIFAAGQEFSFGPGAFLFR